MDNEKRLRAALADRYVVERKVGQGGMATVYLARDQKHDRNVAIKVLDPELAHVLGSRRFLLEIITAANLTHPHILPVHDSGEADGFLYYVMPYVKGESLRQRLTTEQQLPIEDAIRITQEIGGALGYAHREGIIHRDVKPANIMLEDGQAVLSDFGVAHAVTEATGDRFTRPGSSLGTPHYMSPEQASGDSSLDPRSDLYSLGCVLFEMLAGEPPFSGPTPSAVLAKQVQGRVPSLRVVRPSIPEWLAETVEKALAKVPADRYQSAEEFVEALGKGPAGTDLHKTRRARDRVAWGAAAISLAVLGLFAGSQINEWWQDRSRSIGGPPARIAVTYFDVAGQNPALEGLGEALTEYVADALVDIGTLDVISLTAMRPFKGEELPAATIQGLEIDAYVEGSVMGTPDQVSVSVQLIDAGDQAHMESQVVVGRPGEPFAIVKDLATEVSGLLREWLGVQVEMAELQSGTSNERAWSLVQEGRQRFDDAIRLAESGDTVAAQSALLAADRVLAQSEAEDPSYITPVVQRGWVAYELAGLGAARGRFDSSWCLVGLDHAQNALEKAPESPAALELRGTLYEEMSSEVATRAEADSLLALAEQDLRRATELDGTGSRAFHHLSHVYELMGRRAEAKLAAVKAYRADPYQQDALNVIFSLCSSSMELREWTEVSEWCGEGRMRFPEEPAFASAVLTAMVGPEGLVADPSLAWHLAEEVLRLSPPHERAISTPPQLIQVAAVLARARLADSAWAVLDRALSLPEAVGPRVDVQEANARLRLGDVDGALEALARFLEASPSGRAAAPTDWWWREIWDHPGFKALTQDPADTSGMR